MPADQTRLLFLQLVANEKDYLFGQNDKQINVNIGNGHHQIEKITAEGKRARWEKIGQQMVQSGGIHYLGKSYDELRMIYYDMRRRTTEKLKKLEEQEGEEGSRKTTVTLNERDFIILDIIGRNSLTPAIQENLNNFSERISTSQIANSPNSLAGEQSSIMKNEIIGIEEGEERQNQFGRWVTEGQIEDNNKIEEEEDEQNGRRKGQRKGRQIIMNGGKNNEKMDLRKGRKRKGRRMDDIGGGEEEDGSQQRQRMVDSQFEMLVGQAKLNYFNSQINLAVTKRRLIEEQRTLTKAQKVESELRAELLRMEIQQKAKEQQNPRKENK